MDLLKFQNLDLISFQVHYYLMCGTINEPIDKDLETCSLNFIVNTNQARAHCQT